MRLATVFLLPLLAVFVLPACSRNLSRSDCEKVDYYDVGLREGREGKEAEQIDKLERNCSALGVRVHRDRYLYGRRVGLAEHCGEGLGRSDARNGVTDSICAREKVPPYLTGYKNETFELKEKKREELRRAHARTDEAAKEEATRRKEMEEAEEQDASAPQ